MSLSSKGRYRKVHDRVWVDEWFRGLDDDPRMLWFYLLTCEHWHGSLPGLFRCRPETMAADIGWSVGRLREALDVIVSSGKVKLDPSTGLVWIVHSHTYLCPEERTKTMLENWPNMVHSLPECPLRSEAWASIRASIAEKKAKRSFSSDPGSKLPDPCSRPKSSEAVPEEFGGCSGSVPEEPAESPGSVRDMPPALMQDHRPMGAERDILLEVCEEYGRVWRVVPPDLPTGDHQRRFLGALRDPSGGRDVLLAAVRGHHRRRSSPDGVKVGRELRHVVPPATEHGSLAPHRPDMTRVLEYAAADPRRGKARAAAPARPPDPAPAPITPEEAEAAEQRMAEFRRMMAERRASASHPLYEDRAARIAREKSERVAAEAELREHAARRAGG